MYRCINCGYKFDEPNLKRESYEEYYGVGGCFGNHHYFTNATCPHCGAEEIEEETE